MTYTVSSTVKPRLGPPCFKIRSPRCYDHFILVQSKAQSIISRCLWPSVGDRINGIRRLMRNSEAEGETCLKFIFLLLARKSKEKAEKNLTIECRRLFLSHMFPKRAWKWLLGWVPLGRSGSGFMICDQSDYAPHPPPLYHTWLPLMHKDHSYLGLKSWSRFSQRKEALLGRLSGRKGTDVCPETLVEPDLILFQRKQPAGKLVELTVRVFTQKYDWVTDNLKKC